VGLLAAERKAIGIVVLKVVDQRGEEYGLPRVIEPHYANATLGGFQSLHARARPVRRGITWDRVRRTSEVLPVSGVRSYFMVIGAKAAVLGKKRKIYRGDRQLYLAQPRLLRAENSIVTIAGRIAP
jgi:hypothetical protein